MCVIILHYVPPLSYVMTGKGGALCMLYRTRYKGEGIYDASWTETKLLVIPRPEYTPSLLRFEEGSQILYLVSTELE